MTAIWREEQEPQLQVGRWLMVVTSFYKKKRLAVVCVQVCRCGIPLPSWRWNQQVSAAFQYMSAILCGITSWKRLIWIPACKNFRPLRVSLLVTVRLFTFLIYSLFCDMLLRRYVYLCVCVGVFYPCVYISVFTDFNFFTISGEEVLFVCSLQQEQTEIWFPDVRVWNIFL